MSEQRGGKYDLDSLKRKCAQVVLIGQSLDGVIKKNYLAARQSYWADLVVHASYAPLWRVNTTDPDKPES